MNTYITAYGTDIGTKKKVNQDSLCVKIAVVKDKTVCMAVLCDGMGGLSKGELASATVVPNLFCMSGNLPPEQLYTVYNQLTELREKT